MQRSMKLWTGVAVMLGGLVVAAAANAAVHPTAPTYHVTSPATPIASPSQFGRTASLNNAGLSASSPAYYVVQGVQQNGQWQYPFSVSVAGGTVATIPLAVNRTQHTELVEVGIPTPALLQWATPSHGGASSQHAVAMSHGR